MAAIPRTQWITPTEQLQRLGLPIRKKIAWDVSKHLLPELASMVAQYCDVRLDRRLIHWFITLKALDALPEKVPPLPFHIDLMFRQVEQTQFLALIPENFRTLNHLERNIFGPYAERAGYPPEGHPFRFRHFSHREIHGEIPFESTHWELTVMNDRPELHRYEDYEEQAARVSELSHRMYVDYQPPSLNGFVSSLFLCKLATRESHYSTYYQLPGEDPAGLSHIYSHVERTDRRGRHLLAGGFWWNGLWIDSETEGHDWEFGGVFMPMVGVRSFY